MARPELHGRTALLRKLCVARHWGQVRRSVTRRDGVRMPVDGQWLVECCGNDYLGLAQQFQVTTALQEAAARAGVGAGGCGRHAVHLAPEREIADWLQMASALLFSGGFIAHLAVQQTLLSEQGDVCVQDRLNHASRVEASRLAGCHLCRYPLEQAGYWVPAIQLPTPQQGAARVRVPLPALHSPERIDGLVGALGRVRDSQRHPARGLMWGMT